MRRRAPIPLGLRFPGIPLVSDSRIVLKQAVGQRLSNALEHSRPIIWQSFEQLLRGKLDILRDVGPVE
jgi:hypothetical protein